MRRTDESDRSVMLHILRNPAGWSEETVRDVREKAAAELERLWRKEHQVMGLVSELADTTGVKVAV